MKVLFYNHTGQIGGAERVLLSIMSRLDREKFRLTLVCPNSSPLRRAASNLGIPIEVARDLHARFTWRPDRLFVYVKSFVHVILDFRTKVGTIDPDLVHANSIRAGLVATAATIGMRTTVVWHIHDLLPRHPLNPMIRAVAGASGRTRMIAVAKASAIRFAGWWPGLRRRTTVIPNGIDLDRFHPNDTARNSIEFRLTRPVIGAIGRITPGKGQLELVRLFPRVLAEFPNATLLIAGSPAFNREHEYLQLLERTVANLGISDRVRLLGARDDVQEVMQVLDVLVLNSSSEACCLVALEAMACGVPVLATAVGGMPEIITQGENGWLVPGRDSASLAGALISLLNDEQLRVQLGRNARRTAVARFSTDLFIRQIDALYSDLHSSHQKLNHQILNQKLLTD